MSNPNFLTANTQGIELMPGVNDNAVGYDVNRVIQALNGINIIPITTGNLTVTGNETVSGTLNVTGAVTFHNLVGSLTINPGPLSVVGYIQDTASADASPFTQKRIVVYDDGTNWGYMGYGIDAQMRLVQSQTASPQALLFGTTSATNNTGTFTEIARLSGLGRLVVGEGAGAILPQSNAILAARLYGNSFEWGHTNTAGYGSTIGAEVNSGIPFVAFDAEAGTNINTYKTRGIQGSVLRSDLAGGWKFSNIPNANADNQNPVDVATISAAGAVVLASSLTIPPSAAGTPVSTSYGTVPVKLARLTGASANYDFQNIPQGYTSIQVRYKLRDSGTSGSFIFVGFRFNNDSTAHYDSIRSFITGVGITVDAGLGNAATGGTMGACPSGGFTDTHVYGQGVADIPGYSDTDSHEMTLLWSCGTSTGAHGSGQYLQQGSATWYPTSAAAITRITMFPSGVGSAGWDSHSWAEIWGYP